MNIKTTIGIIAVIISSISVSEAGQNRHKRDNDRHYEKSHQVQYYKQNRRHSRWERTRLARKQYREQRYYRKQFKHRYSYKHQHRHSYSCNHRSHRNRPSQRVVVRHRGHSKHALPVVTGGLIGSIIANDASGGDPAATFGGAVFGALVGNAFSRH